MAVDPSDIPISVGGVILAIERGFALYRSFKRPNGKAENFQGIKDDVRNALTTQQLNFDNALLEHREALRDLFDGLRQEVVNAVRERRR